MQFIQISCEITEARLLSWPELLDPVFNWCKWCETFKSYANWYLVTMTLGQGNTTITTLKKTSFLAIIFYVNIYLNCHCVCILIDEQFIYYSSIIHYRIAISEQHIYVLVKIRMELSYTLVNQTLKAKVIMKRSCKKL